MTLLKHGIHVCFLLALVVLAQGCASVPREQPVATTTTSPPPLTAKQVVRPTTRDEIQSIVADARRLGASLTIAGGRQSSGGQAYGDNTILLDMSLMNRVVALDREKGIVEVEAGTPWWKLMDYLAKEGEGRRRSWTVRQKQPTSDHFTVGGTLSANSHGKTLNVPPIVADIESFLLVDAEGGLRKCSRFENPELFSLAVGGYGLFGVVVTVKLKLERRFKARATTSVVGIDDLTWSFNDRLQSDGGFAIAYISPDIHEEGASEDALFVSHEPVAPETDVDENGPEWSPGAWLEWKSFSYVNPSKAFSFRQSHAEKINQQVYWSDRVQRSPALHDARDRLVELLGDNVNSSEVWTEVFVPREQLRTFLREAREDVQRYEARIMHAFVTWTEPEFETMLRWANQPYASVTVVLEAPETEAGLQQTRWACERLVDTAIRLGGTFSLAYHTWARRDQVFRCYPNFAAFLHLKDRYDPAGIFQSSWYRHYRDMVLVEP